MTNIHHGYRYDWKFEGKHHIIITDKNNGAVIKRKIRMKETALGVILKGKWISMQRISDTHEKVY